MDFKEIFLDNRDEIKALIKEAVSEALNEKETKVSEYFPPDVSPRQALVNWCKTNNFEVPVIARTYKLNGKSSDEEFIKALADLERQLGG